MEDKINIKKLSIIAIISYLIIGIAFYFIGGDQLKEERTTISYENTQSPIGEILKDTVIEQEFETNQDIVDRITIKTATYERINKGNLYIEIKGKDNKEVYFSEKVDISTLPDNQNFDLEIKNPIKDVKGEILKLVITSDVQDINNAITLWGGEAAPKYPLYINGSLSNKTIVFSVECVNKLWIGQNYWTVFILLLLLIIIYFNVINFKQKKSKKSVTLNILNSFVKYRFLLGQLIERDFKTKYKRSVLGVLWSFLNPLLTMFVQYIVFSAVFKSDIPNFPVYLLSGIVIFNFFTESCGIGLMSIVSNANLITKVYVPKYIYPVSRVLSSTINLVLSLIPLLIVILITNTKITFAILLVPFSLICTLIFCIGMTLILSSAMVFFRDTQFLWNVISLLWMYITPLFYPENIIPAKFSFVVKVNPMYHFIRFMRTAIMQGISPEPKAYVYCIVFSLGTLFIGTFIFKKTQDKFILNI